jgi:hypothetical protein
MSKNKNSRILEAEKLIAKLVEKVKDGDFENA